MKQTRWFQKAAVQLLLSHVPGGEALNFKLQRPTTDAVRAARQSRIEPLVSHIWGINGYRQIEGANVVDLGTGWDMICSVIFAALGAQRTIACDHVEHARIEVVQQVIEGLKERSAWVVETTACNPITLNKRLDSFLECKTLAEFLECANIEYAAPSRIGELAIDSSSIDILFSYAVLAHPAAEEIEALARESARILRKGGMVYHYIGLQDPYADLHKPTSNVYFLKHSDRFWRFFVSNSINSNNRLRATEHLNILKSAGASIVQAKGNIHKSDLETVRKINLATNFQSMPEEDLAICQLAVVARFDQGSNDQGTAIELTWQD